MSTNWAELDTELSETTTTTSTETTPRSSWTSTWRSSSRTPRNRTLPSMSTSRMTSRIWSMPPTSARDSSDVEERVPAGDGFDLDLSDGRLGAALVFATVSLISIGLGSFVSLMAAPTPVIVAVWVIAAVAGLLALRQLTWGGAR